MFANCTSLCLSTTQEGDYKYPLTFKVKENDYDFRSNILPIDLSGKDTDENGYITVYSKYVGSVSLDDIIDNGGTLTFATNKVFIQDGSPFTTTINGKIDNADWAVFNSSDRKAYITLKNGNIPVASSKKFEITVSGGRINVENIDLYTDDPSDAAPENANKKDIAPGVYDAYMTFVA
jgi:hypothetical protein